jgi:outer membrane protein TolC
VAPAEIAVGVPADLLRRRPDVLAAELDAASQSARIGLVKADLYPSISLIGNFGYVASDWTNYSLGDIFLSRSRAITFGPTVNWNFLNYGRITNNVRFQDALFQERATIYQNTVLRAQQEVEDGLIAFLNAQERTKLLAQAVAAAHRSLELSILQYREGITDFTTVLTAQQDLLAQQDDFAVSTGDIPSGLVQVYRAIGGGWEIRDGQDFLPADVRAVMAARTNWGDVLTPVNLLQPAGPVLPTPANVSSRVRPPEF